MIRLHERERRRLCRVAFLLLGPPPLFAVCVWMLFTLLPRYGDRELLELGRLLGGHVAAESVQHPRPGLARLRHVVLTAPESGEVVATLGQLEVIGSREQYVLSADSLRCSPSGLLRFAEGLLAQADAEHADIRLNAQRLEIATPGSAGKRSSEPIVYDRLRLHLRRVSADTEGPKTAILGQISMQFFTPASGTKTPARIVMRHDRAQRRGRMITVETGEAEISWPVLVCFVPELGALGPEATFRGSAQREIGDDKSTARLRGEYREIDLGRLFAQHTRHTVSGRARLTVERLVMQDGRLLEMAGSLAAGTGRIDESLLEAARGQLYCQLGPIPTSAKVDASGVPFEQLSMQFTLSADGLSISGTCRNTAPGTVLVHGGRQLLSQPMYLRLPIGSLVSALTAEAAQGVTQRGHRLATRLPATVAPQRH